MMSSDQMTTVSCASFLIDLIINTFNIFFLETGDIVSTPTLPNFQKEGAWQDLNF